MLNKSRIVYIARIGDESAVLNYINNQGETVQPASDLPEVIEEIPVQ